MAYLKLKWFGSYEGKTAASRQGQKIWCVSDNMPAKNWDRHEIFFVTQIFFINRFPPDRIASDPKSGALIQTRESV